MRRSAISIAIIGLLGRPSGVIGAESNPVRASDNSRSSEVVATMGGKSVSAVELDRLVGNRLLKVRNDEYNLRRRILEEYLESTLLQKEAEARGVTIPELIRLEVDDKVPSSPSALSTTGDQSSSAESPRRADPRLREDFRQRRRQFIKELYLKADVNVFLEPPRVLIADGGAPSRGPSGAPVTIVEFVDYQCPFCGRAVATLKRLEDVYRGKVRFVVRDFPLPGHEQAQKAAEAAACAAQQGKFWEMHDRLFDQQASVGSGQFRTIASSLDLDATQFAACLESGRLAGKWRADQEEGVRCGIGGTPTLFVNGRMVNGLVPYETLVNVVEDELARSSSRASPHVSGKN